MTLTALEGTETVVLVKLCETKQDYAKTLHLYCYKYEKKLIIFIN